MAQASRQFEAIVFGATGYTGKYTAEHIASHFPTDFRWAIAGRSENKLRSLQSELKAINTDRRQPDIEISQLVKDDLVNLAKKTKVLITTVGPYHKYGTAVLEACAETGTHYLDVTGEVPWVYDMVHKYHHLAKRTGAIIIPQNGVESAPPDLMCWKLVSNIRETFNVGTTELVHTIYDMKGTPSGGTLSTVLTLFDTYSMSQLAKAQEKWSLSAVQPPQQKTSKPMLEKLTGVRHVPDLGTMTDSLQGPADVPIIHRSWSLYDGGEYYGRNFHVSTYMRARNVFTGFGFHVALLSAFTALILPPVRWLLKQFVYQPGEGPTKEQVSNEYIEWRAIASADMPDSETVKRAYGRMRFDGSMYHLTGICLAESALILAREKTFAHELGGGLLTPATLGATYLERLEKAGLQADFKML